jgi:hypothetical protein
VAEGFDTPIVLQNNNLVYDVDIMRFLLRNKTDFSINMNTRGAMIVEIKNDNSTLNYITTPLKK